MTRIYRAENLAEAYLVSHLLKHHGIANQVFNEFANGAVGELPFTHTWPEVWIKNDRDEATAREIIANRVQREADAGQIVCSECGENSPANFDFCWNCSTGLANND